MNLNREMVNNYKLHLFESGYSNGSIRTKILSVSSFYKTLSRIHTEIKNHFEGTKLPPNVVKKERDVVMERDLIELKKDLKRCYNNSRFN